MLTMPKRRSRGLEPSDHYVCQIVGHHKESSRFCLADRGELEATAHLRTVSLTAIHVLLPRRRPIAPPSRIAGAVLGPAAFVDVWRVTKPCDLARSTMDLANIGSERCGEH
jgi:hypothetical protein